MLAALEGKPQVNLTSAPFQKERRWLVLLPVSKNLPLIPSLRTARGRDDVSC
jgi:hypothetical protein